MSSAQVAIPTQPPMKKGFSFKGMRKSLSFTKKAQVAAPVDIMKAKSIVGAADPLLVPSSPLTVIEVPAAAEPKMASVESEIAAVKVQAAQRGRTGRTQAAKQARAKKMEDLADARRAKKATMLQAVHRGRSGRTQVAAVKAAKAETRTETTTKWPLSTWEVVLAVLSMAALVQVTMMQMA